MDISTIISIVIFGSLFLIGFATGYYLTKWNITVRQLPPTIVLFYSCIVGLVIGSFNYFFSLEFFGYLYIIGNIFPEIDYAFPFVIIIEIILVIFSYRKWHKKQVKQK